MARAPFHFKEKINPAYGNGYWEREILPIMEEVERSFRALRSGVVASVVPSAGYVLCQSNHADVKFEVLQGWTSSTHKVVNGQVNLGMTSGDNFGANGIALRFDSYQRRDGSEYANLDSLAALWHKRVTEKPTQLGRITATRDFVLNGLPARRLEMFLESGKTSYRRWIILVETPQKLVEFNLSGYETPTNPKDKSFKQVAVPAGIRLMRTISSTRKDLFGSAELTGFQRDEQGL